MTINPSYINCQDSIFKPVLKLTMPTVCLYGKDGLVGKSQLPITAEVDLLLYASG